MSGLDNFNLSFRILYGNCVPAGDVIKLLRLLKKANDLSPLILWKESVDKPAVSMTRQEFIASVIYKIETSLKAYVPNENTIQSSKGEADRGSIQQESKYL